MTSSNLVATVIKALATDAPGRVSVCWKDPTMVACSGGINDAMQNDFIADCILHARMHQRLSALHYMVLVARYSPDFHRKLDAVMALLDWVKSAAPKRFRHAATATWALPKPRAQGGGLANKKHVVAALPDAWYCMDSWSDEARPVKTQERWRREIRRALNELVDEALIEVQELIL